MYKWLVLVLTAIVTVLDPSYILIYILQFLKSNVIYVIIDYTLYVYDGTKYARIQLNYSWPDQVT